MRVTTGPHDSCELRQPARFATRRTKYRCPGRFIACFHGLPPSFSPTSLSSGGVHVVQYVSIAENLSETPPWFVRTSKLGNGTCFCTRNLQAASWPHHHNQVLHVPALLVPALGITLHGIHSEVISQRGLHATNTGQPYPRPENFDRQWREGGAIPRWHAPCPLRRPTQARSIGPHRIPPTSAFDGLRCASHNSRKRSENSHLRSQLLPRLRSQFSQPFQTADPPCNKPRGRGRPDIGMVPKADEGLSRRQESPGRTSCTPHNLSWGELVRKPGQGRRGRHLIRTPEKSRDTLISAFSYLMAWG